MCQTFILDHFLIILVCFGIGGTYRDEKNSTLFVLHKEWTSKFSIYSISQSLSGSFSAYCTATLSHTNVVYNEEQCWIVFQNGPLTEVWQKDDCTKLKGTFW